MSRTTELLDRLTAQNPPASQRTTDLSCFAHENGWRPSDKILEHPGTQSIANGHLVVEHGLSNTAVITFLKRPYIFPTLPAEDQLRLLSISYNSLVDWHLFPDAHGLTWVYVLRWPTDAAYEKQAAGRDVWRAESFDRLVGRRPSPNVKNLEDALVATISKWKRILKSEIPGASNPHLSSLFNGILFARALEDMRRWRDESPSADRLLLHAWEKHKTPRACLLETLRRLGIRKFPEETLGSARDLSVFDRLGGETTKQLLLEFYENKAAPYPYDFSLISKQALSRIYEHYVSLLREKRISQTLLFPDLPEELQNRRLGGVYTPQYIARFFARVLKDNHTPPAFRKLRVADPACGSGMFLRTILEMQCDPSQEANVAGVARRQFRAVLGIDVDLNACRATRLSLSLLHVLLTNALPQRLAIENAEAIQYFLSNPKLRSAFNAVIANPPFVKWDRLSQPLRGRVADFLSGAATGRIDLYLAHLKVGMQMTKPGGFLLYVLPHSFLLADSARGLRREIAEKWWIRFLVDLSDIPVFEDVGSYVILLVLQKPPARGGERPRAIVARCREFVGQALEDALEGKHGSTEHYTIYAMDQSALGDGAWEIMHPRELWIKQAVERHARLGDFLTIREGFITGDDDTFIRDGTSIPKGEKEIYAPYLPDRGMRRYDVPASTGQVVFYPYSGGRRMTLQRLQKDFPKTWAYLSGRKERLSNRKSVASGGAPWWCPVRARPPQNMMRPKIISPHLVLTPRFSLDAAGKYAVSHSPVIYPKAAGDDLGMLQYFVAVLNSSVAYWQILRSSHRYDRGYVMLEPKTLKNLRAPKPSDVDPGTMKRIHSLVGQRLAEPGNSKLEAEIDVLVASAYGLSAEDLEKLQGGA